MIRMQTTSTNRIIIDASVIVKWFIQENGSDKAEQLKLLFLTKKIEFHAPNLIYYEVLNALRRTGLLNQENLNIAAQAIEQFHSL